MEQEPLLSVIVPVYNAERYLHQCIDSILDQTYGRLDIILVNDGSTDSSGRICDEYEFSDSRVRVIHQTNKGLKEARKTGVEHAKGACVTFVDADDWIDREAYMSMIMAGVESDVIVCGIYRYYSSCDIKVEWPGYPEGYYNRRNIEARIMPDMLWKKETNRWNLDPSLCTKIFKRELLLKAFDRADGINCYFGEDSIIFFPVMFQIGSISILKQCHYYHRQRGKGEIPSYIQDENFFDLTYQLYRYLKDEFKRQDAWEIMKNQLEHFFLNALEEKRRCYRETIRELYSVFPFEMVPRGAAVILYGAGKVGRAYASQIEENQFCHMILWVDREYRNIHIPGYCIENPEKIRNVKYDYIVIAIDIRETAVKVKECLKKYGASDRQIVWHSIRRDSF